MSDAGRFELPGFDTGGNSGTASSMIFALQTLGSPKGPNPSTLYSTVDPELLAH